MTMVHERPQHTDTLSYWGLTSPSESENVIGSPDGLFMWSTGPVMSVQSFDVSSSSQYVITDVRVVLAFKITDALLIDSVRLSMDWSNGSIFFAPGPTRVVRLITSMAHITNSMSQRLMHGHGRCFQLRNSPWIMFQLVKQMMLVSNWMRLVSK